MADKENKKKPNPTDMHVGSRIKLRRNILGMSQAKLAEDLGITFQQVQKYEKGTNRVGASRLQAISNILGVPVAFFFEDLPQYDEAESKPALVKGSPVAFGRDFCTSAEGLQLNRAFVKIGDLKVRRSIIKLVQTLAPESVV